MPDVSIALSAKDNFSDTLKKLANNANTSVKDVDALQKSLTRLSATKVDLRTNLDRVKSELGSAKKEFLKLGDAASEAAYKAKQSEYDTLSSQLKAVSNSAKQAERDMQSLAGTNSKLTNRAGMGESSDAGGMGGSMLGTVGGALATAGFGKMLAGSLQGAANTFIGSYFGDMAGSAVSSVLGEGLSGAAMGAAAGSIIPGVGTAIGAAVGGVIGAVSGGITAASENFEKKDDAFKSYVQGQVEDVLQKQAEDLTSGSGIAGTRESTKIAFTQKFGSEDAAANYLEQVRVMAAQTNYTYDEITGYTKQLLNSYDASEVLGVLGNLSDATAGLNLDSSGVSLWVSGLNRMRITDKATTEYLNYFSERGLNVYEALSNALGVQESQVQDMVTRGKVSGSTAAQAILDYIGEEFGGLSDKLSSSYEGLLGNLEDANADLQAAMGEGYNKVRKPDMQAELNWLSGETGQKMQDAYSQIGAFQAGLENTRNQMERDALTAVMENVMPTEHFDAVKGRLQDMANEYAKAAQTVITAPEGSAEQQAAEYEQGKLLAEARVMAQNEYNASEGAQIVLDGQIALAQRVAADTSQDETYYNAGLRLGQQYTKGISAAISAYTPPSVSVPTYSGSSISADTSYVTIPGSVKSTNPIRSNFTSSAYGTDRVPRDNMLYLLHQGERVQTAQQARQDDMTGGGVTINVTGGNYSVRQDSDIDAIAREIARNVALAFQTIKPR